ncbi:N-acetyl-gamma-glutamyl-phosphate reductase [Sphingomonas jeddahensis]|uniref:N-acetyl-gamma-glutamyl-phosphate reductase n=1 Tax=Sphingomonas jeddahensis TaxID=1915074 RepID=A0A1V2EUG1_9SPHN|nr:N-acetyl-gamma-glutamyl-phosphate reductase [Sphingomonas jeddahensis]ONF95948.1 N-acetyl-gamma-glutamyl-phosphate reductase [Sphingomonas jeddahensis]
MTATVFIDGAVGTTGLEIRERLAGRRDLSVVTLPEEQRKDADARREAINAADVVILCLPDDAAREAVALIDNPRTRVIDASSAHRVAEGWTYGFPELGFDVAVATRVTNPGCYPTGFLALVEPLVRAGLLPADAALAVHGTSGYSGGGKGMIAEFEGGNSSAHRAYALGLGHKHVPEMTQHAGLSVAPIFMPSVANIHRGMVIEVPIHAAQLAPGTTADQLRATLAETFANAPLVRVANEDAKLIRIEDDAATDRMTLHVFGSPGGDQFRLVATLDNLGKGASGAAVQNLNLMIGADPMTGLVT